MTIKNMVVNHRETTSTVVILIDDLNKKFGLPLYTTNRIWQASNIAVFCYLVAGILQVIGLIKAKDDAKRLFECFSILAFSGMGILKLSSLHLNHKRWRCILEQVSKLENEQLCNDVASKVDDQCDAEERVIFTNFINKYTERFKAAFSLLRKIYYLTLIIFMLSPFLDYIIRKIRRLECLNYPHILPGWNPLDNLSIFGYLGTVLCEFVAAVYCVLVHTSFDLTVIGIVVFVCGQFSMLYEYSSRIGGKGEDCKITKKRDERARVMIKHCHRIHLILVNTIVNLDKLLQNILGVYFLNATLTLCFVALRVKSEDMSVMQLVSLLQYMFGILIQLFLFCWYGDAVLNMSSITMGQGPFGAAHWCLSPRVRRDLCMLSAGMMRSRHLRAGPFNRLDLPSFVQIVRAAYSYYAVLGTRN